jgi:modification methylase
MLPALARRIVDEYSEAGDLVVDPMAGAGTTLVEAAHLGRRAIGVELEPRWVGLTRRNLRHTLPPDRRRLARIVRGDARRLPVLIGSAAGRIDLVVVSPPFACDAGTIDKPAWLSGRTLCDARTLNYSRN